MALINENGHYLKIDSISFETINLKIYKNKDVRNNPTEFDLIIERTISINSEIVGALPVDSQKTPTIYAAVMTAGYVYLKKLSDYSVWIDDL